MKRKKRLVEEFEKLLQEVIPANYSFPYQRDTIKLYWWCEKLPMIDIYRGDGGYYTIYDFSKIPLLILKVLVKELTKHEKIKRKTSWGI